MVDLPRAPKNDDQKYLAAIIERLDRANGLLSDLLGRPASPAQQPDGEGGTTVRHVSEPAPAKGPRMAQPVAEPNRGRGAPPPAASPDPDPPARPAANASTAVWAAYADALGLAPAAGASRADLIQLVDGHTRPARRRR